MTKLPVTDYDCVKCGACCATNWQDEHYVYLSDGDVAHIPEHRRDELVVYTDGLPSIGLRLNKQNTRVCAALSGKIGNSVACTIYEHRPFICRHFEPGSMECDYARREMLGISLK